MILRRAEISDMEGINKLLEQVCLVHHKGRPDLFKFGAKKYTDEQLAAIICDDSRPIFVAVNKENQVLGYAFCIFQQHKNDNILTDIRTLYLMICAWMKTSAVSTSAAVSIGMCWISPGNPAATT